MTISKLDSHFFINKFYEIIKESVFNLQRMKNKLSIFFAIVSVLVNILSAVTQSYLPKNYLLLFSTYLYD
jgi:hypothetical protein